MSEFFEKYKDRMRQMDSVELTSVEEGCGMIECPNCKKEIQLLEDEITECPECHTKYTMKQVNLVYMIED